MDKKSVNAKERQKIFKKIFFIVAIFIVVFIAFGIFAGCKSKVGNDDNGDKPSEYISFGSAYSEAVAEIDTSGGVILIDNEDSVLNGMKITVPSNAYNMPINFAINSYQINSHKLGLAFNPITPIIEINNGQEFAKEIIELEIPINIDNRFAMGFYYDQEKGTLEAIPSLALEDNKITLGVKHFSKIVVTDISLSTFQNLSSIEGSDYDTGFVPMLDDWHYTNYGSAIAGGGHCGGQSLTMAWYYTEKHLKESAPRLYGSFDNNEEIDTPDFWQDDNNAYRFSSVVQANAKWADSDWIQFINYSVANPEKTYQAFAYAIKQTKSPQFMAIFPDGPGIGHAIVAYKVEGNKIYVADPNYPAQTDRYVEYDPVSKTFLPYSSGANAADITQNGATSYTKIVYAAKSALIDYSFIAIEYDKMLFGTVGDTEFPDTQVEVMNKYNNNASLMEYEKVSREIKLGNEFINSLPEQQDSTIIRLTPLAANLVYTLYLGNNVLPEDNPSVAQYDGAIGFVVDWVLGVNEYAILVEQYNNGYYDYVDFIRVRIIVQTSNPLITIAFDSVGGSEKMPITQEAGSVLTAPPAPTKTGYVFGGWYSDYSYINQYVFTKMPYEDMVLYAKWINSDLEEDIEGVYYLYTIDGRKDWGVIEYQYYDIKGDGTYSEVFKAIANNDTINYSGTWSLNGDIVTFNNGSGTYQTIADGEYLKDLHGESPYFVYKRHIPVDATVSISFDCVGGTPVTTIMGKPGSGLAAPTAPTRSGYRFGGWYTTNSYETQYFFGTMPNRNMTVYARWIDASSTQKVNIIYAFHSNYSYNSAIYTFEYDEGDDFPYEHMEYWTNVPAGYKFLGYYTDSACTTPLTYTTIPNQDVYVYTKLQLLTESDILGKYYKNEQALQSYLDYYYIEFLARGIFKEGYKRNDTSLIVVNEGTWTSRILNGIIVFDVDWPNTSFDRSAVFYEDWVSCDGTWYREPYSR